MHFLLAFFGLSRSLPFTIQGIQENIMQPIVTAGFSFDVHVHTWKFSGLYSNNRSEESSKILLNFDDTYLLQTAARTVRRKLYTSPAQLAAPVNDYVYIQDQDAFDVSLSQSFGQYLQHGNGWAKSDSTNATLLNHVRALFSLKYLHDHIISTIQSSNVKYDAVVFLRPDVMYMNELPAELVYAPDFASTLYLPDFHRSCCTSDHLSMEYNDRFAFGGLKAALAYSNRYDYAMDYARKHVLHAERFLYWHLVMNMHVPVKEISLRFRRIRANSLVSKRDQLLLSPSEQLLSAPNGEKPTVSFWNLRFSKRTSDTGNVFCHPHPFIPINEMAPWQAGQHAKDRYAHMVKISHTLLPEMESPEWLPLLTKKEKNQGKRPKVSAKENNKT